MAKIKIDDGLLDRVKKIALAAGYGSPEELIVHIIERELSKLEAGGTEDEQKITERLRGLGYLE
jgi:hypothetical protein